MTTRSSQLYKRHTMQELVEMSQILSADPGNRGPDGQLTRTAQRRADDIRWAIQYHLQDTRRAQGLPIITEGYSGRNSKRSR